MLRLKKVLTHLRHETGFVRGAEIEKEAERDGEGREKEGGEGERKGVGMVTEAD